MRESLYVQTLGRFRVLRDKSPIPDNHWGTHRAKTLLKLLLTRYGQALTRDQISESIWQDVAPAAAASALYTAVSDLRRALEPHLAKPSHSTLILSTDDGYQFSSAIDRAALDKVLFAQQIANARTHVERNEFEDAAQAYAQAEALYAGDYLPDDLYADWSSAERERLRALFLAMLLEAANVHAQLGRYREAIACCRRTLELDSCSEEAYRALMVYYDASGARPQALRTYNECEVVLQRELGVKPTRETTALYESIKDALTDYSSADAPITNLPIPLTSFIGRQREIAEVKKRLGQARLLTITGTGGSGKTRLAIQVATGLLDAYQDGVWWVELAALRDPAQVVRAVATTLRVRELLNQSLAETLADFLRTKQLLLVLDNCEHLIAASAQLANGLLTHCSNLKILATSREALGVGGEMVWQVPTLTLPAPYQLSASEPLLQFEAIRLFVERAAAMNQHFLLTRQNAPAVVQICRRLDGMPLAIELAAARGKTLSPEQIAARLDDRFNLLTIGSRTAPTRQQTLRATIDWSYDLLSERERLVLQRFSVFAGSWPLETAEAIGSGSEIRSEEVLGLLSQLVDKSLVLREEQNGQARYRLLDTIRQYSAEKLQATGEMQTQLDRHLGFFLQVAQEADVKLRGSEQMEWSKRLGLENDNLQAALQWSRANPEDDERLEKALRLAGSLAWFWIIHGDFVEGLRSLQKALQAVDNRRAERSQRLMRAQAEALHAAGMMAWFPGDMATALQWFRQAEVNWNALDDRLGLAYTRIYLAQLLSERGDLDGAQSLWGEAIKVFQEANDEWGLGWLLCVRGRAARDARNYPEAREDYAQSMALMEKLGDKWALSVSQSHLGIMALQEGNYAAARSLAEPRLTIGRELESRWSIYFSLNTLGIVALAQGNYQEAVRRFQENLILSQQMGHKRWSAEALDGLARSLGHLGKTKQAVMLSAATDLLLGQMGGRVLTYTDITGEPLRAQLGEEAFVAAGTEGRALSLDEAIELALRTADE